MFFGRLMIKDRDVSGVFLKFLVNGQVKEVTETITVVLFITYKFYKK